jgi:hypothetical protein
LTTTSVFQIENEVCSGAIPSTLNEAILGTTLGSEVDNDEILTCGTPITAGGVWYTAVAAHSGMLSVLICADYDTKVSVFSGNCIDLECIGGNDNFIYDAMPSDCANPSAFVWDVIAGETYFLLVSGRLFLDSKF